MVLELPVKINPVMEGITSMFILHETGREKGRERNLATRDLIQLLGVWLESRERDENKNRTIKMTYRINERQKDRLSVI